MASGDSLWFFDPLSSSPPSSDYATQDLRVDASGYPHRVLDFDDSATEKALWKAIMPQHYDGGGVTAYVHFTMSSDNNNGHGVRLDGAFEDDSDHDMDTDGFAAVQSATGNPNATLGKETIVQIAFTDGAQMDSVGAGDLFRFLLQRDHDHGDDDATGDMELHYIELRET